MAEKKITPTNPDKVSDQVEDQDKSEAERTTMNHTWGRKSARKTSSHNF